MSLTKQHIMYISYFEQFCHLVLLCLVSSKIVNETKILKYLKKQLPNYMIPKKLIMENKLRFNKNGKVDKVFYMRVDVPHEALIIAGDFI